MEGPAPKRPKRRGVRFAEPAQLEQIFYYDLDDPRRWALGDGADADADADPDAKATDADSSSGAGAGPSAGEDAPTVEPPVARAASFVFASTTVTKTVRRSGGALFTLPGGASSGALASAGGGGAGSAGGASGGGGGGQWGELQRAATSVSGAVEYEFFCDHCAETIEVSRDDVSHKEWLP